MQSKRIVNSPGSDNVTAEIIKYSSEKLMKDIIPVIELVGENKKLSYRRDSARCGWC